MNLKCPYCEADCGYPDDFGDFNEDHEAECLKCGKTFLFDVEYDPIFTERKAPCLNGEPHDYKPIPYYDPPRLRCKDCNKVIVGTV